MVQYQTMAGGRYEPPPDPFAKDGWDNSDPDVRIECLMPSGIVVALDVPKDETLENIKQKLWESQFPLRGMLRDMSQYVFHCVTPDAEAIELLDETCPLISVRPVFRMLRVIEREGDKHEKLLLSQIGNLIGRSLHIFESHNKAEVNEFRSDMRDLCARTAEEREAFTREQRIQYSYPCPVLEDDEMPEVLRSQLGPDGKMEIVLVQPTAEGGGGLWNSTTWRDRPDCRTSDLVHYALMKALRSSQTQSPAVTRPDAYTLKVVGRQQYLMGDRELWRYGPTQEAIARGRRLRLQLVNSDCIPLPDWEPYPGAAQNRPRAASNNALRHGPRPVSSWEIQQEFSLTVKSLAHKAKIGDAVSEIGLEAALFCGGKPLCDSQLTTMPLQGRPSDELQLGEILQFSVQVRDLPRMTRLSLAVYEVARQPRGVRSVRHGTGGKLFRNYLAWCNAPVYDYRGRLRRGTVTLYLWPYSEQLRDDGDGDGQALQPLATAVDNPDADEALQISVEFHSYCDPSHLVVYPTPEEMLRYVRQADSDDAQNDTLRNDLRLFGKGNTESVKEGLAEALEKDMRALDLEDCDKDFIWSLRHKCHDTHPNALPKLLQCVDWSKRLQVAEMTSLLEDWRLLTPDKSLALLDANIADPTVRKFAVRCLEQASDDELQLYLLQLVQALKHENYLFSELAKFMLIRAVKSKAIAHWLFWHLRSEMHEPSVYVRNALLLEAYFRATPHHMLGLTRLHEALKEFEKFSALVKEKRNLRHEKEKIKLSIKSNIDQLTNRGKLRNITNPLDQSVVCRQIKSEEFKFFESKMAPLKLIFDNIDKGGEDVKLIFKVGDDLRQDMLTLQIIRIIDKLWKEQGLDLRLNPYGCISTGPKMGVIELVDNASTVANIHKSKSLLRATGALRRDTIFNWLKEKNPDEARLRQAVDEFSRSCAGYSVLTFVFGVADRHSDNIMVKENGQLLHIDFGHILGHFKHKYGIKRERVPFVLTSDFVYVITEGNSKDGDRRFNEFKANCEKAYQILRRHSDFIISLFGMMLSTGLPDVASEKDLCFLHNTLRPDLPEAEALRFFQEKFTEAQKNSLSASFNNVIHNMVTDNA